MLNTSWSGTIRFPITRTNYECLTLHGPSVRHDPLTLGVIRRQRLFSTIQLHLQSTDLLEQLGLHRKHQKDPCENELLGRRFADADLIPQVDTLRFRQRHPLTLLHDTFLTLWASVKLRQEFPIHHPSCNRALVKTRNARCSPRSYLKDRPEDDFVRSAGWECRRTERGVEGDFEGLPVPIGSRADGATRTGFDEEQCQMRRIGLPLLLSSFRQALQASAKGHGVSLASCSAYV